MINRKIFLVFCSALILTVFFAASLISYLQYKDHYRDFYKRNLIHMMDSVSQIIDEYEERVEKGAIPENQAKEEVKNYLRELRYGQYGYFWIMTEDGYMVMHPVNAEIDGTQVLNYQDKAGSYIAQKFIQEVEKDGEGYVEYLWPRPGQDYVERKLTYIRLNPEWHWIIGTGFYMSELETIMFQDFKLSAFIMLGLSLLIIPTLFILFVSVVTDRLNRFFV